MVPIENGLIDWAILFFFFVCVRNCQDKVFIGRKLLKGLPDNSKLITVFLSASLRL